MWKSIIKFVRGERSTSKSANFIEQILDADSEDQAFFDVVHAHFESYDESNRAQRNECFSADIDFIIDCVKTSLTSPEHLELFPRRIDAYFYIYRRITEYVELEKKHTHQLKEFQRHLHEQSAVAFKSTEGLQPNFCIENIDLLKKINIRQHLAFITEINDIDTLDIFFTLCKLSFQSSLLVDDHDRLQWIDIFSKIHHYRISFTDIISRYISYKQAFEHCPLDISAIIHLIRRLHPPKNNQTSPFDLFMNMLQNLNLDSSTFFHQFKSIFAEGLGKQLYTFAHIASLLQMLSTRNEQLFNIYLTSYSPTGSIDVIWSMFWYISKTGNINDIMQKGFSEILAQRMQTVSVETFKRYFQSTKACLKQIKDENRPRSLNIFETVFHAFLYRQLGDDQYSRRLTEEHLKQFFNVAVELSLAHNLQQPPYSLVIRHLLFKLSNNAVKKSTKITDVLERLNRLDQYLYDTHDPSNIIHDEWLSDCIFVPQEWLRVTKYDYQTLCDTYHSNRWSNYIWSKIVHLSFHKWEITKPNEILTQLNEWMNNFGHSVYDANDILTNIFVKNIFEIIIAKYIKSVLSLQSFDSILPYILKIRQETPHLIDAKLVDDFVENIKLSIKNVLLLNGKTNC